MDNQEKLILIKPIKTYKYNLIRIIIIKTLYIICQIINMNLFIYNFFILSLDSMSVLFAPVPPAPNSLNPNRNKM